ncbi:hypothetical protein B9Z55_021555 [Caenorhabditis nigoni]|uniref:DUF38 domain-containing protein n=1 Tax=Caenorhabditis nigoni TaxID=1611254 RepID=A0A2G5TSL2_9PELO|nr:hypothetical protein B9Z55_021555 [Caenorhabditis nigoni]
MSSPSLLTVALQKVAKNYSNPKIEFLGIPVGSQKIGLQITFSGNPENQKSLYPKGNTLFFEYEDLDNHCKVLWHRSDKNRDQKLKNSNFIDRFFIDFLAQIPMELSRFTVDFFTEDSRFLEAFKRNFETKGSIKTKEIALGVQIPAEIFGILHYTLPGHLKKIEIMTPGDSNEKISIGQEIGDLDQWKLAEILDMEAIDVADTKIEIFKNFREANISFSRFSMENVDELKTVSFGSFFIFQNSNVPQQFRIGSVSNFDIIHELLATHGQPFLDTVEENRVRTSWFFKIPNDPEKTIRISLFTIIMEIARIPKSEIPRGATILG